jgi:hypothetical protein
VNTYFSYGSASDPKYGDVRGDELWQFGPTQRKCILFITKSIVLKAVKKSTDRRVFNANGSFSWV